MLKIRTCGNFFQICTWSNGAPVLKRCSRAARLLLNCLPEGAWQPLPLPSLLPKQVQPLAVVIGSSNNDIEGSDLMEVEEEAEEVEMRLAESWEGFIIPDMKVDWLGSELRLPSPISSMEKLVRLESEKLELVARVEGVKLFASIVE